MTEPARRRVEVEEDDGEVRAVKYHTPKHVLTATHALAALPFVLAFGVWIINEARGQSREESRASRDEVASLRRVVTDNRTEAVQGIQLTREELKEVRTDIRALSREVRTGQPTARLSTPVPELRPLPVVRDGGP